MPRNPQAGSPRYIQIRDYKLCSKLSMRPRGINAIQGGMKQASHLFPFPLALADAQVFTLGNNQSARQL